MNIDIELIGGQRIPICLLACVAFLMATHMALRGLEPGEADIAQVLQTPTMLISVKTVCFRNRRMNIVR